MNLIKKYRENPAGDVHQGTVKFKFIKKTHHQDTFLTKNNSNKKITIDNAVTKERFKNFTGFQASFKKLQFTSDSQINPKLIRKSLYGTLPIEKYFKDS